MKPTIDALLNMIDSMDIYENEVPVYDLLLQLDFNTFYEILVQMFEKVSIDANDPNFMIPKVTITDFYPILSKNDEYLKLLFQNFNLNKDNDTTVLINNLESVFDDTLNPHLNVDEDNIDRINFIQDAFSYQDIFISDSDNPFNILKERNLITTNFSNIELNAFDIEFMRKHGITRDQMKKIKQLRNAYKLNIISENEMKAILENQSKYE